MQHWRYDQGNTVEGPKMDFFKKILKKDCIYLFFERGREGEREREKHQCVVASCTPPTGDLACSPGMCPDWESNPLSHPSQGPRETLVCTSRWYTLIMGEYIGSTCTFCSFLLWTENCFKKQSLIKKRCKTAVAPEVGAERVFLTYKSGKFGCSYIKSKKIGSYFIPHQK